MLSIKVTAVVLAVLGGCLLPTNESAAVDCCRHYVAGKIPFHVIKGYSVQTIKEMCPINAIIFHTRKGKRCTNPALDWVMKYVNLLRQKAQIVHHHTSQAHK